MKPLILRLTLLGTLLVLGGCVVAPVPLVETENLYGWAGLEDGKYIKIMGQSQTWYLPIVVSPEGPAKMRRDKSRYRYYFTTADAHEYDNDWPKLGELTWLEVETDFSGYWRGFSRIEGTPYWVAFRLTDFKESVERSKVGSPPMRIYEIAVFDRKTLKFKKTINACNWPSLIMPEYMDAWKYDRTNQTLEYKSPEGMRRLGLLTGVEELVGASAK